VESSIAWSWTADVCLLSRRPGRGARRGVLPWGGAVVRFVPVEEIGAVLDGT